jgi:arylsulfatase
LIVVGGTTLGFRHGAYHQVSDSVPMFNLLLTIMHRFDTLENCVMVRYILLLALSSFLYAGPAASRERPNILCVIVDDLGFSDMGCFGGEIETPVLDALAAGGVRLTQFYNTGRCCPSRASILTGQYPHRVGLGHMTLNDLGHPGFRGKISEQAVTVAQVLQGAGYRSFIAGKWHLGTEDPTQHGFEEFYGTTVSAKRFFDPDHLVRLPAGRRARQYAPGEFYATDAVTDHALDFVRQTRETPNQAWFLYLAYNAPHFPLHAPQADIAKYADRYHEGWDELREKRLARMKTLGIVPEHTALSARSTWHNYGQTQWGTNPAWKTLPPDRRADLARRMAIYAAMVDRLDQQLGRIIDDLKAADELDNTLILFTSDNGACFEWHPYGFDNLSSNENILHTGKMLDEMGGPGTFHSVGSAWANASNTPWRMYKHFNHEGGIASPGIVHWPAGLKTEAGAIHHHPAHIIDILPTAIAVSGVTYEGSMPLPGFDLVEQLHHPELRQRVLFFEHQGNRAVRDGKWKLVAFADQPWELYDIDRDRTEEDDLAIRYPERVASMNAAWETWASENQVTPLPDDLGVDYLKAK